MYYGSEEGTAWLITLRVFWTAKGQSPKKCLICKVNASTSTFAFQEHLELLTDFDSNSFESTDKYVGTLWTIIKEWQYFLPCVKPLLKLVGFSYYKYIFRNKDGYS